MKQLGVAIIGCGTISKLHADSVVKSESAKLITLFDIDYAKSEESAKLYDCESAKSFEAILQDERIDVVHICTPHYLHAQMAIDCLKNNKHVVLEKPIGIDIKSAQDIIAQESKCNYKVGVCLQNRYNETSKRIKELLDSNSLGKVLGAKASVTWHRNEAYYKESNWRGTLKYEGGGLLINQAIHTLDLLIMFFGDIQSLKGNVDARFLQNVIEVEDTAEATLRFESGVTASFYATNGYPVNSPVEIEIICEKAVIRLKKDLIVEYQDGRIETVCDKKDESKGKDYWGFSHNILINDFYKKIISEEKFEIDLSIGLGCLQAVLGIYESSKIRDWVSFK